MVKYLILLRGINVGGKRKILMTDLKILLGSLGFENIITYIQSGNVICDTKVCNLPILASLIEQSILTQFGFEVPVVMRTWQEINFIYNSNPYTKAPLESLYITFLKTETHINTVLQNTDTGIDAFFIKENNIYVFCKAKYSTSKLSNNFFEKQFNTQATTRSWKTLQQLYNLMNDTLI